MNAMMLLVVCSRKVLPLKRTGMTALGWIRRLISATADLANTARRTHLIPPAVEPEAPPVSIRKNTIIHSTGGQII